MPSMVDKVIAKVEAARKNGGMREINRRYKS
jgi:hypothetical protein